MLNKRVYNSVPAFIALAIMAAPGAVLPCLAGDGGQAHGVIDSGARKACCAGCDRGMRGSAEPEGTDQSPHHRRPCDCPAECPAPCGSGKPPCPPADANTILADMAPAGFIPRPASRPDIEATLEDIFHPPRV
ncbi:MAG: hypothetical protein GY842_26285 [bacterium]|nr:hypothetical protein [bacterium]